MEKAESLSFPMIEGSGGRNMQRHAADDIMVPLDFEVPNEKD